MNKELIAIALGGALSISIAGQKQKADPDTAPTRSAPAKQDSRATEPVQTPMISAGTALEAQLQSVVDVRKGQVGDQIILRTTKAIKQNGEVLVPKGTQVLGRITEIQRRTKDNAVSRVGMVFDRIQGKDLDAPVNLSIVSVASAATSAAVGDVFNSDISGSSNSSASSSSRSGGGLLGSVAPAVGGVVGGATQTVGSVTSGATQTLGQTTGAVGNTLRGLSISQSASGSASSSSTLSAQGRDIRIDKGATFNLMVNGSTNNLE